VFFPRPGSPHPLPHAQVGGSESSCFSPIQDLHIHCLTPKWEGSESSCFSPLLSHWRGEVCGPFCCGSDWPSRQRGELTGGTVSVCLCDLRLLDHLDRVSICQSRYDDKSVCHRYRSQPQERVGSMLWRSASGLCAIDRPRGRGYVCVWSQAFRPDLWRLLPVRSPAQAPG
jgi:hypothetical protein